MWCIGKIDPEYRERMYDILDLYEEPHHPQKPVLGVDEKSKQLTEESKERIKIKPGSPEKYDYEYKRNGTANIFMAVEATAGRRKTKVMRRRTKKDFAEFIKELVDVDYKDAQVIRIVLDNLNTHFQDAFYETFGKEEAERILSSIELHYTPKHASWLNVAEIEINVMERECTGRRMKNIAFLTKELSAWTKRRNDEKRKIKWRFTKQDADRKLSKHYAT